MKKTALPALFALIALLFSACSPSPSAVTVGTAHADAAEYAFYVHHNVQTIESDYGYVPNGIYPAEITDAVKADALDQLVTAQVIRLKCRELGLKLTDAEIEQLKTDKQELVDSLGGKYAFLGYLRESALTDRTYDSFAENALYYNKLYDYVAQHDTTIDSDEELRRFFAENYITVKYIRLGTSGDEASYTPDDAKSLAEDILREAKEGKITFEELMETYNDDPMMSLNPEGIVIGIMESRGSTYLEGAFTLAENEVGGVYTAPDGLYVVKRLPVSASYFDENRDAIHESVIEWKYSQQLEEWKTQTTVTTSSVYKKINLENYMDYVK